MDHVKEEFVVFFFIRRFDCLSVLEVVERELLVLEVWVLFTVDGLVMGDRRLLMLDQ